MPGWLWTLIGILILLAVLWLLGIHVTLNVR